MAEKNRPGTLAREKGNTRTLGGASERTRSEERAKELAKRDEEQYGLGLDPDSGDENWPRGT